MAAINDTKSQLSSKSLMKLRKKLPYGAVSEISKTLNLNKSTVSRVLLGKTSNMDVIAEAIKIVERSQRSMQHFEGLINKI